jgi:hypothetical protein
VGRNTNRSRYEEDLPSRRANHPLDSRRKSGMEHGRKATSPEREGDCPPVSFVVVPKTSRAASKGEETQSRRGYAAFAYF